MKELKLSWLFKELVNPAHPYSSGERIYISSFWEGGADTMSLTSLVEDKSQEKHSFSIFKEFFDNLMESVLTKNNKNVYLDPIVFNRLDVENKLQEKYPFLKKDPNTRKSISENGMRMIKNVSKEDYKAFKEELKKYIKTYVNYVETPAPKSLADLVKPQIMLNLDKWEYLLGDTKFSSANEVTLGPTSSPKHGIPLETEREKEPREPKRQRLAVSA